jgi:hypothetical protein
MGWVKIVGKGLEFGRVTQADGFEQWLDSTGQAFLEKFISDEGLKVFSKSRAKSMLISDLQKALAAPSLQAAVNEEVHFFISHVGMLAEKLASPATTPNVVIVPRILVSVQSRARLLQELGNSEALLDMKGGKDLAGYFIDQLNAQLDEALVQLVYKRKIVPVGNQWFIIDLDTAFEWMEDQSPRGHFVVVKPYLPDKLDKDTLEQARQQEEKIIVNLGKMSRSEIDALLAQWKSKVEA